MTWTQEMRRRGAECASPEELAALARAEGLAMTDEEARAYFAKLHPPVGELSDDELEAVSGGGCGGQKTPYPVGTAVGILDTGSDVPGALIRCGGCQGTRFIVTKVVDYDTVWVECENHCKKAFSSRYGTGVIFEDYSSVNILSLHRM